MKLVVILTACATLLNAVSAKAEDYQDLPQPGYIGAVTGDTEKDTFGYDAAYPSDLQIRFKSICEFGTVCPDTITTGALRSETAGGPAGHYFGSRTGDAEKDTFAH